MNQNDISLLSGDEQIETMRREIAELKSSLEKQKIFGDTAVRRLMQKGNSWNVGMVKIEKYVLFPLLVLIYLGIKFFPGTSWIFFGVTVAMFAIDIVWDVMINRVKQSDYTDLPLLDLEEKLLKRRRDRKMQMVIELPLIVVWIAWFCYELISHSSAVFNGFPAIGWVIAMTASGILGICVAIVIYSKQQNIDTEAINRIKELRSH